MKLTWRKPRKGLLVNLLAAAVLGIAPAGIAAAPAQAGTVCPAPSYVYGWPVPTFLRICEYDPTYFLYTERMHIFVVGIDYAVWHVWQIYKDGPYVSSWYSLGGIARSHVTGYHTWYKGIEYLHIKVRGLELKDYCKDYNKYPYLGQWYPSTMTWYYCPFG